MSDETKPTNPKDALGTLKLPIHLWPNTATILGVMGLLDGALKYGRANWRPGGARASVYYDAARRHLDAWMEGEEHPSDSNVHHLGFALACIAILVDAEAAGVLEDDRMFPGGYSALVAQLTPQVLDLKELHHEKDPKHWTIKDKA